MKKRAVLLLYAVLLNTKIWTDGKLRLSLDQKLVAQVIFE